MFRVYRVGQCLEYGVKECLEYRVGECLEYIGLGSVQSI